MKAIREMIYDLEVRPIYSLVQEQNPIPQGNYRVSLLQICEDGDVVRCGDLVAAYNLISSSLFSRLDRDECQEALIDPKSFVYSLVEAWTSGLIDRRIQRFRWGLDRPEDFIVPAGYTGPVNILEVREYKGYRPIYFCGLQGSIYVFYGEGEALSFLNGFRDKSLYKYYILQEEKHEL